MRILYLSVLALVCGCIATTASFAQNAQGYASEESKQIKESLDLYQGIFGRNGSINGAGLNVFCMPLDAPLKLVCLEKADEVTKLYRNAVILLKDQPEKVGALPDVYSGHYKSGRMADMAVTDQIGKARFQYTFVAFLMWYVQCHPLPTIGKVPLQVQPGPVEAPRPAPQS
jgi:hypothetical protein